MRVLVDHAQLAEHTRRTRHPAMIEKVIDLDGNVSYLCRYCQEPLPIIREIGANEKISSSCPQTPPERSSGRRSHKI